METQLGSSFSIAAILGPQVHSLSSQHVVQTKQERPESPSSTTSACEVSSTTTSSSISISTPSPSPPPQFPQWTQCQRDAKKCRRPYSRAVVAVLSWWFHHLPFLTVQEMEVVGMLTRLTRQQVKVWWQNRRHSQRGRQPGEADPYLGHIHHLPVRTGAGAGSEAGQPGPGQAGARQNLFRDLLAFYYSHVRERLLPGPLL